MPVEAGFNVDGDAENCEKWMSCAKHRFKKIISQRLAQIEMIFFMVNVFNYFFAYVQI